MWVGGESGKRIATGKVRRWKDGFRMVMRGCPRASLRSKWIEVFSRHIHFREIAVAVLQLR